MRELAQDTVYEPARAFIDGDRCDGTSRAAIRMRGCAGQPRALRHRPTSSASSKTRSGSITRSSLT